MKALKRLLLVFSFTVISLISYSQSGWSTGRYYAYQGQSTTQYQYKTVYDYWCKCYKTVKYCRQLNWYQEYRSGYVYYWGPSGWYSQYREGYFWYCTWSGWYSCY